MPLKAIVAPMRNMGAGLGSGVVCCVSLLGCVENERAAQLNTRSESQALEIVEGSTNDPDCGWFVYKGHEVWGCKENGPVGPKGGGAPASDWGLCGLTKVAGNPDAHSVLRIGVNASGYYELIVAVGDKTTHSLQAAMSCAKISDFTGLPAASFAKATKDYEVFSQSAPDPGQAPYVYRVLADHGGDSHDVCLWTGFDGNVNAVPANQFEWYLMSGTMRDSLKGWTVDAISIGDYADSFNSFARCDGYSAPNWHDWFYFENGGWDLLTWYARASTAGTFLPLEADKNFCWLTGISTLGPDTYAELKPVSPPPPNDPNSTWFYQTDFQTAIGVECVAYDQQ